MKLTQINNPALRRRAKEIVGQDNAASKEQAQDLVKALTDTDLDGRCFGSHEGSDVRCKRCWLEAPCERLDERFRAEWAEDEADDTADTADTPETGGEDTTVDEEDVDDDAIDGGAGASVSEVPEQKD
jgi:hypothetical protein